MVGDAQSPLDRATRLPIRTGQEHAQWPFKHSRQHIARTQTAPCQAQNRVEWPSRSMDRQRQPFDQLVVVIPRDMQLVQDLTP